MSLVSTVPVFFVVVVPSLSTVTVPVPFVSTVPVLVVSVFDVPSLWVVVSVELVPDVVSLLVVFAVSCVVFCVLPALDVLVCSPDVLPVCFSAPVFVAVLVLSYVVMSVRSGVVVAECVPACFALVMR